jgi:diguanylate cyclase (GGDEF)-like protein
MKKKIIFLVLALLINVVFLMVTHVSSEKVINTAKNEDLANIQSHHKNLFITYKNTSDAVSKFIYKMDGIISLLAKANAATTKEEKKELRDNLAKGLKGYYNIISKIDVYQFQFVLSNGESFYKFHNPTSFGENILLKRKDFRESVESKSIVRGFYQSDFSNGFRNIFPLFDANKMYIGSVEVSFSGENFQNHLHSVGNVPSHFVLPSFMINYDNSRYYEYETSYEHPDYKSLSNKYNNKHTVDGYKKIKDIVISKMKGEKAFCIRYGFLSTTRILYMVPVRDMNDELVAWTASNSPSITISRIDKSVLDVIVAVTIMMIIVLYFLIKQLSIQQRLAKQEKVLSTIFNVTNNIMFITDFRKISFTNKKFDDLIDKEDIDNVLNIFQKSDGFLHEGMLEEGEEFTSLIKRTDTKDCIVSIQDKNNHIHSYSIHTSKVEEDEYLVALSNVTEIHEHLTDTKEKAYIDSLTKVFNRNKFNEEFEKISKQSLLNKKSFSLAIIDIDKFKTFNDTYGHLIGDEVLVNMAQTVQDNIREVDFFARWGGEEFVLIFQNVGIERSTMIANKIRRKIQENNHKTAGQITASFGITQYKKNDTLKSIIKRCDDALYRAKENGRNRVEQSD